MLEGYTYLLPPVLENEDVYNEGLFAKFNISFLPEVYNPLSSRMVLWSLEYNTTSHTPRAGAILKNSS